MRLVARPRPVSRESGPGLRSHVVHAEVGAWNVLERIVGRGKFPGTRQSSELGQSELSARNDGVPRLGAPAIRDLGVRIRTYLRSQYVREQLFKCSDKARSSSDHLSSNQKKLLQEVCFWLSSCLFLQRLERRAGLTRAGLAQAARAAQRDLFGDYMDAFGRGRCRGPASAATAAPLWAAPRCGRRTMK